MRKEDLFDGFGRLDDELLKRSEQGGNNMKKNRNISKIVKFGSIAACFVIAVGVGVSFMDNDKTPNSGSDSETNIVAEENHNVSGEQSNIQEETEDYVDIEMLLASIEGAVENTLVIRTVEIEEYTAMYYKVTSVDSAILKKSTGGEVEGAKDWYRVLGHEDMQYLIWGENDGYSLWKFDSFQCDSYPYNDVLQVIYNIHSGDDITDIIVNPANMDNTEEGKAIQAEIGTRVIADDESIETFYDILSGLTCYGSNHWEMIGLGADSSSDMQNAVRAGRYLTLVTSQGMEIDTLKYTGISGMFYEYGGIAYNALNVEEKNAVEKILNVEAPE